MKSSQPTGKDKAKTEEIADAEVPSPPLASDWVNDLPLWRTLFASTRPIAA